MHPKGEEFRFGHFNGAHEGVSGIFGTRKIDGIPGAIGQCHSIAVDTAICGCFSGYRAPPA